MSRQKHEIFVRLESGVPAQLLAIDSKCPHGKYKVIECGKLQPTYHAEIRQRITKAECAEYKPTKPASKRSKKNV